MGISTQDKRASFRKLHEQGCFVLPNPWDIGSAKYLQSLGFKALASTSAGFAWTRGCADMGITLDMALEHLAEMANATDLPLNADFENGFGVDAAGVKENVRLACATGVSGVSIEDASGVAGAPLFSIDVAVDRMKAARSAIDSSGADVMLIGRAECFLYGITNLDEVIARLQAYSNAGADCLYAPGLSKREDIAKVVAAVSPKPFNLLIGNANGLSVAQAADLGVRRISVGGALARAAWGGFMTAAQTLAQHGSLDGFANAAPGKVINALF